MEEEMMATEKRLIDANALKIHRMHNAGANHPLDVAYRKDIDNAPTVDAVEVVHGHWDEDHWEYVCSCCQKHFTDELPWISHPEYGMPNYCPNCGAKMDGDGNG
jgi:DNA-directed RNA polymerase subunit RPC12/RpoP